MVGSDLAKEIRQMARLAFWLAFAVMFAYLAQDYLLGGNGDKQGDWLINIEQVAVRRGLLGSVFIHLADALHMDLLLLVVLCQAAVLLLLACLLYRIVRVPEQQPIFWLLLFCPAFVLMFWGNDPHGSLRKEIFVYCAFALVLAGLVDRRRVYFGLALASFTVGALGHEANVLFLPAFLWLLYRLWREGWMSGVAFAVGALLLTAVSAVSAAFVLRHIHVTDVGLVCAPLLERGFEAAFCDRAITWVTRDLSYAIEATAPNWSLESWTVAVSYLGWTAGAWWFSSHFAQQRRLLQMYVLTALPFLPLYYIALDWGRWMNFHLSSWIFLLLAEHLLGRLQQTKPCNYKLLYLMVVGASSWAPAHMNYQSSPRAVLVILVALILRMAVRSVLGRYRQHINADAHAGISTDTGR